MVERLPEGGEGMYGIDDGQGDEQDASNDRGQEDGGQDQDQQYGNRGWSSGNNDDDDNAQGYNSNYRRYNDDD